MCVATSPISLLSVAPVKSADSPDSIETLRTILTDGLRPAQKALIEGNYGG